MILESLSRSHSACFSHLPSNNAEANTVCVGPVFPVLKWKDEEEVLRRANDSPMGLGASVWTRDIEQGERMAKKLKAGTVWINTHLELQPNAPFGGHKQSGIGAEHGVEGIKSYSNTQALYITEA